MTSAAPSADLVMRSLARVIDPEMAIDIVALGLVYGVDVAPGRVGVRITMTSAACPVAELIMEDVAATLKSELGESFDVGVELVWDPPWTPERISERARDVMGW